MERLFSEIDKAQRDETADVIFRYFGHKWAPIELYKEDISAEELSNWDEYSEEEKQKIQRRVRRIKLKELLDELNGEEIIDICQENENREDCERRRTALIELVELLRGRVS